MIIRYNKYSIHSLRILIIIYIFIVIEQLNVFAPKEIKLDTQNMQQQKMITKQKKMFLYKSKFSYRTQSNLWWKTVENNKLKKKEKYKKR